MDVLFAWLVFKHFVSFSVSLCMSWWAPSMVAFGCKLLASLEMSIQSPFDGGFSWFPKQISSVTSTLEMKWDKFSVQLISNNFSGSGDKLGSSQLFLPVCDAAVATKSTPSSPPEDSSFSLSGKKCPWVILAMPVSVATLMWLHCQSFFVSSCGWSTMKEVPCNIHVESPLDAKEWHSLPLPCCENTPRLWEKPATVWSLLTPQCGPGFATLSSATAGEKQSDRFRLIWMHWWPRKAQIASSWKLHMFFNLWTKLDAFFVMGHIFLLRHTFMHMHRNHPTGLNPAKSFCPPTNVGTTEEKQWW